MNKVFIEIKPKVKDIFKFFYEQFTDLGVAFLPTARGAELPLPDRNNIKDKMEKRTNNLETL